MILSLVISARPDACDRAPDAMSQSAVSGRAILVTATIADYMAAISTNLAMRFRSLLARFAAGVLLVGIGTAPVSFSQTPAAGVRQPIASQKAPLADPVEDRNPLGQQADLSTSLDAHPAHDSTYWLAEQEKAQSDRLRLQAEVDELTRKIDAPALNNLRDELNSNEAFIAEAKRVRIDAEDFVSPAIARGLDWVIRSAEDHARDLRMELDARTADLAPEQARLKLLRANKMDELNSNGEMLKAVASALQDARKARSRQNKIEELRSLDKIQGYAGVDSDNVGALLVPTPKP
jgi:hypothetical protein